jgi:hypothetical protein
MAKAKRARKAETPKQPSRCLRLRAPYLYPDNLLVCEGSHGGSCHRHCADRCSIAQQRHAEHGTPAPEFLRLRLMVFWIGKNVRDMNQAAFECNSSDE